MKIKQCLLSFPVSVICFICLLVGIICYNNYLNNYKHRLILKQLMVSSAMLKTITAESEKGVNKVVADKLSQLKRLEKSAAELSNYGQIASVFVLLGSLLLAGVFFYNLHRISSKLNTLAVEVEGINKNGLEESNLNYSFDNNAGNEIDCLANSIEKVLMDFKKDYRRTTFMLRLFQECNKQLKQQLGQPGSKLFH